MLTLKAGGSYLYVVGYAIEEFCIVITMLWLIRNHESAAGRVLNWTPARKIGVMSYSLYLWQTLFLHRENHSVLGRFPFNLLAIFVCALFSYVAIETPSLKLRDRFVKRAQRSAAQAAATSS